MRLLEHVKWLSQPTTFALVTPKIIPLKLTLLSWESFLTMIQQGSLLQPTNRLMLAHPFSVC